MSIRPRTAAALLLALATAPLLAAEAGPRRERVAFAKGAASATIQGKLTGHESVDYLVDARAGQTISVALKVSNEAASFNLLPPGSADAAMFVSQAGEAFTGTLPDDGDYAVRVYLVRAAARRNEASDYTLTIGVTGQPLHPLAAAEDATLPGTRFHAAGTVSCVPRPYADSKPQACEGLVVRRGHDGTATVEIRQGDFRRRILFVAGKPVAADTFEAMKVARQDDRDTTVVTFDSGERHEIVDALLTGG